MGGKKRLTGPDPGMLGARALTAKDSRNQRIGQAPAVWAQHAQRGLRSFGFVPKVAGPMKYGPWPCTSLDPQPWALGLGLGGLGAAGTCWQGAPKGHW